VRIGDVQHPVGITVAAAVESVSDSFAAAERVSVVPFGVGEKRKTVTSILMR
jgi:hypothetical protein